MVKRIYLELSHPVCLPQGIDVLPVSLTISDETGRLEAKKSYLSVMPDPLGNSFRKWQKYVSLTFQDSTTVRRIRFDPKQQDDKIASNYSNINFEQFANDFKANLNRWLETGWFNEDGDRDNLIDRCQGNAILRG
jgi:hypothetical protein